MRSHYIIESFSAYEAAKSALTGEAVWHTQSPYIYESLKLRGENVCFLEEGLEQTEVNNLAKASYDFTFAFVDFLNDICTWREYADLKLSLAFGINNCLFPTLYKSLLLQRVYDKASENGDNFFCVGDPDSVHVSGLQFMYGLYETLFAFIAADSSTPRINILKHTIAPGILKKKTERFGLMPVGLYGKFLSFLNNDLSSFLFKAYKNLSGRGLFPYKKIGLSLNSKRDLYIYKDCELIDELFSGLLLSGGHVGFLKDISCPADISVNCDDLPFAEEIEKECGKLLNKSVTARNLRWYPLYNAAADVFTRRVLIVLARFLRQLPLLTKKFEESVKDMAPGSRILSNALTGAEARLFYSFCKQRNIEVVAFEHGTTYGLSKWSKWCARHAGMLAADIGVYHSERAASETGPYCAQQKKIIAGLPSITGSVRWPGAQRWLARKWLGLERDDHVVMFVVGLERNNRVYGPYVENDFQRHAQVMQVMDALINAFPDSVIIMKLYPAIRYVDFYDYSKYDTVKNVKIVIDVDFRFIRAAADMIFLGSSQSTLGWSLGAGATVLYLEQEYAPVEFKGLDLGTMNIENMKSVRCLNLSHISCQVKTTKLDIAGEIIT